MVEFNYIQTPKSPAPNIIRIAYVELVTDNFAKMREFYVDILGLVVTYEDNESIYLRTYEEFIHHNLVIRKGSHSGVATLGYRVTSNEEVDKAEAYFNELGCDVRREKNGFVRGNGDSVRVLDNLGYPHEYFFETEHQKRLTQAYQYHVPGALTRMDHINLYYPEVPVATKYFQDQGFKITEDLTDENGVIYAAWMTRKPSIHDVAVTGGTGPRLHHLAFGVHERHEVLNVCDRLAGLRLSDRIERGPGRHGISNAMYVYLWDPDGNRVEIFAADYWTGDPDNPKINWSVHDNQMGDFWGAPKIQTWYTHGSTLLDLDGNPVPTRERTEPSALDVTIGADGFVFTREGDEEGTFRGGDKVARTAANVVK